MKNHPKKKVAKKTVSLVKSLGELMKDEEGHVSRETILKVGLSTVAGLGAVGAFTEMASGCANICTCLPAACTHTNLVTGCASVPGCFSANCSHLSHSSHSSY